ncbi:hypothetical protein WJX84_007350 [Apatococcus fuscideae]|uniref:MBD domain-containing protein n=1 Tax=Apatococcus fuscideae TaxID=2026836 RepID=A0AAW1T6Q1_9CHLO
MTGKINSSGSTIRELGRAPSYLFTHIPWDQALSSIETRDRQEPSQAEPAQSAGTLQAPEPARPLDPVRALQELRQATQAAGFTLEDGWTAIKVVRKDGKSKGGTDIYFISPAGKKLKSQSQGPASIPTTDAGLEQEAQMQHTAPAVPCLSSAVPGDTGQGVKRPAPDAPAPLHQDKKHCSIPDEPAAHPPVPVKCGSCLGTLSFQTWRITCECQDCSGKAEGQRSFSGPQWEAHGGHAHNRKWRSQSVRVVGGVPANAIDDDQNGFSVPHRGQLSGGIPSHSQTHQIFQPGPMQASTAGLTERVQHLEGELVATQAQVRLLLDGMTTLRAIFRAAGSTFEELMPSMPQ